MAKKLSLLDKMRRNPKSDWTIQNVQTLCGQVGLWCDTPSSGSHYIVGSDLIEGALSVPFKRPIKVLYIKQLVALADCHIASSSPKGQQAKGRELEA